MAAPVLGVQHGQRNPRIAAPVNRNLSRLSSMFSRRGSPPTRTRSRPCAASRRAGVTRPQPDSAAEETRRRRLAQGDAASWSRICVGAQELRSELLAEAVVRLSVSSRDRTDTTTNTTFKMSNTTTPIARYSHIQGPCQVGRTARLRNTARRCFHRPHPWATFSRAWRAASRSSASRIRLEIWAVPELVQVPTPPDTENCVGGSSALQDLVDNPRVLPVAPTVPTVNTRARSGDFVEPPSLSGVRKNKDAVHTVRTVIGQQAPIRKPRLVLEARPSVTERPSIEGSVNVKYPCSVLAPAVAAGLLSTRRRPCLVCGVSTHRFFSRR